MRPNQKIGVDEFPDELIVDARHADLVTGMLRTLADPSQPPLWPGTLIRSDELDLVLLRQLELADYAARARVRYANEIGALEGPGPAFSNLDVLLYDLRARFAEQQGFVPVMGKNREAVIGHPQHKAVADPTETTEGFEVPPTQDGHDISIGVVDTPLAPHNQLPLERVKRDVEADIAGTSRPPWVGHATFVAGLIRRQAPGAEVRVRAGLSQETGTEGAWDAARTIAGFAGSGIAILNLSLGCVTADNQPPLVIRRALDKLGSSVLVVAAAGNRGDQDPPVTHVWPGAVTSVVAVGAEKFEEDGEDLASFSVRQPWVDCTAPGVRVVSTYPVGSVITDDVVHNPAGVAAWSGTSFATATVSGAVAATMTTHDLSAQDAFKKVLELGLAGIRPFAGSR